MSCIGCKNFYYRSDGSGCCDMPYKNACLNNNFQFYQLSSGFSSKEEAERYFRQKFLCGLRAKASFLDDYLVEDLYEPNHECFFPETIQEKGV